MQFWQCPLLLMVSLIAAINTQQTPSQRLEPNEMGGLVEQQQVQQQSKMQQMQEQPTQSDNKLAKRAWSDLAQQGWGKRSWNQLHGAWGKRRWDQLHGAWGKRTLLDGQQDDQQEDDDLSSSESAEKSESDILDNNKRSGWNKMQGVWGKRNASPAVFDANDLLAIVDDYQRDEPQPSDIRYPLFQDDQSGEAVNKRAWNQMQGVWGKRALSAMAAGYKRNWNNLRGAWGKREMPVAVAKGVEWSRKRESGWNNLKGLWG